VDGAVLFDFDGVVVDTESAVVAAWRADCAALGVPFDRAAFVAAVGVPSLRPDRIRAVLGPAAGDPAVAAARIRARLRQLSGDLPVLPGVHALLTEIAAAGVPAAVVSGATREWVHGHLDRVGLRDAFDLVVCRDDVRAGKPAPDLYLAALAALDVPAGSAVAIEDTATGVAAARAAGVRCVAVPGPVTVDHDFSGAATVLTSLAGVRLTDLLPGRSQRSAGRG